MNIKYDLVNDGKHLSMGLVAIPNSCLMKYLFISFAHFTIRLLVCVFLFCFLLSSSENSLYITDIGLCQICDLLIFFPIW